MKDREAKVHYDRALSKNAGYSEAQVVVQELKAAGIENVHTFVAPVWFVQLLQAARTQGYHPQWVSFGATTTYDTVANPGCRGGTIDGALGLTWFPAWIDSNRFDPDFRKAMDAFYPEENGGDDFMWLQWAMDVQIAKLLALPGVNLTRERFVYFAERAQGIKNGISPTLKFSPNGRFGASHVHVSQARCTDNRWHTIMSFVNDF